MASLRLLVVIMGGLWASFWAPALGQEDDDAMGDEDMDDPGAEALTVEQLRAIHKKFDLNSDSKASMAELLEFAEGMRREMAKKDVGTIMEEMDLDKDGKLSLEELLKDMDMQSDDESEHEEMKERKELETTKFKAADKDGNGELSVEELPAMFYPENDDAVLSIMAEAAMKQKDKDSDGKLSLNEFLENSEGDGNEIGPEEQAEFKKLDKDGNDFLNMDELKAWESGKFHTEESLRMLFDVADKNKDGHITIAELEESKDAISESDAQYHLMEWVEHHEL